MVPKYLPIGLLKTRFEKTMHFLLLVCSGVCCSAHLFWKEISQMTEEEYVEEEYVEYVEGCRCQLEARVL